VRAEHAPLGLCPACLLTAALATDHEPCPYRVLAPMGEDSLGVTYLAQALTGTRAIVALKIYRFRDDAEAVLSRYVTWKPVLATLTHPGLARFLDVGLTGGGELYVASEYVAGWPLTSLASHASIESAERTMIARHLKSAIEAAHTAGLVHLKLDASRIKISTTNGLRATILGLGASLIVDGAAGPPDVDRLALSRIIRELGIAQDSK
jgi:serine/threonine protein kinase